MASSGAGSFVVKVDVLLTPPAPFCRFYSGVNPATGPCADKTSIPDYLKGRGWDPVLIDSGAVGAITAPETRTITLTLGKLGATQAQAEQDVLDAFNNVGWTGRISRAIGKTAQGAVDAAKGAVDQAAFGFGVTAVLVLAVVVVGATIYARQVA